MTFCTVSTNTLFVHTMDTVTEIPLDPQYVTIRSPHHFIVSDKNDVLLCQVLVGLNEIYINDTKQGHQCPMNEQVVEWFSSIT